MIRVNGVMRENLETHTAKRRRLAEEVEGRSRRWQPSKQRRRYCPAPAHCDVAQTDDDVAQLQQMARAVQLSRLFKGVVRAAGVLALAQRRAAERIFAPGGDGCVEAAAACAKQERFKQLDETYLLSRERTFTSPGPWPLS